MHLLITRPREDAEALAARLLALGHTVLIDPLLSIDLHSETPMDKSRVQALLVTSANGLRAMGKRADLATWADVPLFAVGPTTAALAQEMGFASVHEAQGDVVALAALVERTLDPEGGPLMHLSSTVTAGDLKGTLERGGFWVETMVLYEAQAADHLSPETIEALRNGRLEGVLLYSRRSADIFSGLCAAANLTDKLGSLTAYCLSGNAASPLQGMGLGSIQVASAPNEKEMLALFKP